MGRLLIVMDQRADPNSAGSTGTIIEVAIGPGSGPGRFKVEVVRSPAGEATEEIELDPGALLARRRELQQALLASAVPTRRYLSETEQPVREVGEALYRALLGAGEVAGRYRSAATVAQLHDHGLRLSLRIDTPELAGLPWEAMYDQSGGNYVCLQDQLVRRVNVASVPAPLTVQPPLRILGITSAPRGLPSLDAEKERDLLERALARPLDEGLVRVTWAPTATWADLQDLLHGQQWHVLHFIGHGDFDPVQDEGVLVLTDESGRPDPVEAHRFTDLLREARPRPRLVVLNSCSGAAVGVTDLFSGTAAALVRGGVSAVAAMQYEISDAASTAFSRGFYSAIAHGRGVDDAVSSGRRAIRGTSGRTLEWLTPVLYLRGDSTQLFEVPAGEVQDVTPVEIAMPRPYRRMAKVRVYEVAKELGVPSVAVMAKLHEMDEFARSASSTLEAPVVSRLKEAFDRQPGGPVRRPADTEPSRLARTLIHPGEQVLAVAFSPGGEHLATGSHSHAVRIWDPATALPVLRIAGHENSILGVAFSPDGLQLASCGLDRTTRLWDTANGVPVGILSGHKGAVNKVAFSPDGKLMATSSDDGTARLWGVNSHASIRIMSGHGGAVTAVAFSPDGALFATASLDRTVKLWTRAEGELVRTLAEHDGGLSSVAFSPDGALLATTSIGGKAFLWATATGQPVRTLVGHTDRATGASFSPDGHLLATASEDGTVRLWDIVTGESIGTLFHGRAVTAVAFKSAGRLLATGGYNAVRIWK